MLGKITHDCLVSVQTVPGCIGVGEAIEGVTVAGFDGVEPSLLDRKAQAGMIETNQGTNAGEIKAARVKWGTCGTGGQGNSLGCTVQVVDQAGDPGPRMCRWQGCPGWDEDVLLQIRLAT